MEPSQSTTDITFVLNDEDTATLYKALKKEQTDKVLELCGDRKMYPDGPLQVLTIHDDTVLHVAAYTAQAKLVIKLLEMLIAANDHSKLTHKNAAGNTILHEAAAFNKLVTAAEKMLKMEPQLLSMRNQSDETALFRAVCYGKFDMFTLFDREARQKIDNAEVRKTTFYQKPNKSTILHAAVISGHFRLAHHIARKLENLIDERDKDGMTALQHLSRNSSAFQDRKAGFLKRLSYKCVPENYTPIIPEGHDARGWRVPLWEEVQKEKTTYDLAKELAKFLVKKDTTSWKKIERVKESSSSESLEPPLFLATKAGCLFIVDKILDLYPQAVEYIDGDGRTILHLAIKYRQMEIFDKVAKRNISIRKLIQKTDKDGNSILHMVAEKSEYTIEQMNQTEETDNESDPNQGKAGGKKLDSHQGKVGDNREDFALQETNENLVLQLQDDLLLFERIKKICSEHFYNHSNNKGQTAQQLFGLKSEKLHKEAKEWLKRTAENSSIVAVLIATVAFAAAYTVPGGSNSQTGVPVLLNKPLFIIFTVTDVLSLTCTLTSLVVFLSILTSTFRLRDFRTSLPQKLMLGFTLLIMSVSMMMFSFAATIALMIHNKEQWTKVSLYTVAFLPVTVFVLSYMPLYLSSLKSSKHIIQKIGPAFPRYTGFKTNFLGSKNKNKTKKKSKTKSPNSEGGV